VFYQLSANKKASGFAIQYLSDSFCTLFDVVVLQYAIISMKLFKPKQMTNKTPIDNSLAYFSGADACVDVNPLLIQAYLETDYCILGDNPFTFKVGIACPALAALHQVYQVTCSAFVTACNPFSQRLSDAENARRQAGLAQILQQRGIVFLDGIGQHPSNDWPGEPSYLVPGIDLEAAKDLGNQLKQNAIIWNDIDAVPQLILLRPH